MSVRMIPRSKLNELIFYRLFVEFSVKILASNKIDVGDMSGKFEFFNKQFGASGPKSGMVGNHLILFDGKKQQIIKLDASIGLKQLAQKTI